MLACCGVSNVEVPKPREISVISKAGSLPPGSKKHLPSRYSVKSTNIEIEEARAELKAEDESADESSVQEDVVTEEIEAEAAALEAVEAVLDGAVKSAVEQGVPPISADTEASLTLPLKQETDAFSDSVDTSPGALPKAPGDNTVSDSNSMLPAPEGELNSEQNIGL